MTLNDITKTLQNMLSPSLDICITKHGNGEVEGPKYFEDIINKQNVLRSPEMYFCDLRVL